MLTIDISSLSLTELRQLSNLAKSRGQPALAEAVRNELRSRTFAAPIPANSLWSAPLTPAARTARMASRRRTSAARPWALAACAAVAFTLGWGLSVPDDVIDGQLARIDAFAAATCADGAPGCAAAPPPLDLISAEGGPTGDLAWRGDGGL